MQTIGAHRPDAIGANSAMTAAMRMNRPPVHAKDDRAADPAPASADRKRGPIGGTHGSLGR